MRTATLGFFLFWGAVFSLQDCLGQGTKADFARAARMRERSAGLVYRTNITPRWLPDGEHLWYRVKTGAESFEYVSVDLEKNSRRLAFDHQSLAAQLSEATGDEISADNLQLSSLDFSEDMEIVYFGYKGQSWAFTRADSQLREENAVDQRKRRSRISPTLWPSVTKGGDVEIEFFNDSEAEVRLIWIDPQGKEVPYHTLAGGKSIKQHSIAGHVWIVANRADEVLEVYEANHSSPHVRFDGKTILEVNRKQKPVPESGKNGPISPDKKYRALVREHQLFVRNEKTGKETQLSYNANAAHHFSGKRFFWSPDSKFLVGLQMQPGQGREIHMVESSPKDQLQPKLHTVPYVKPGDRIDKITPRMFRLADKTEIEFDRSLTENPWKLTTFKWLNDSSEFIFLFNQRGHQTLKLVGFSPETGAARAIIDEQSDTFIDYTRKVYLHHLVDRNQLVWLSERDGWNHLYLYDIATGQVRNQITKGQWVVRQVDRVDEEAGQIWFRASGMIPGQDPYYIHHCRVDLDGKNLTILTEGNGTHATNRSPNGKYLIDAYSRVDLPEVTNVRLADDGSLCCELERGDWSELIDSGWKPPVRFSAKARDGKTDIYGIVHFPSNFDESKQYPVIERIYAGPHGSFVPKQFTVNSRVRDIAELGFIVVQIDGMGTSNRSKAFHDVCWKNIGDAGFPDRILWIKEAAKKFPQMDLSRVGIFGGSAGGQNALRALLAHGDFYHVAVADCGCHDNRMDKIWWNEQWMGWPLGPHYAEQSNVTQAHKLQGKLFLVVGELDTNVDPASTMQVVDALVKADKDFDLLVIPGVGHGAGARPYGWRRTQDFLVRHLHGVEPRAN